MMPERSHSYITCMHVIYFRYIKVGLRSSNDTHTCAATGITLENSREGVEQLAAFLEQVSRSLNLAH